MAFVKAQGSLQTVSFLGRLLYVGMRQTPSLAEYNRDSLMTVTPLLPKPTICRFCFSSSSSHPRQHPDTHDCCLLSTASPECGIDQIQPAHHNGLTDSSGRTSAPTRTVENQGEIMKIIIAIALALSSAAAMAHGGGLDKNGCHTNHKTGDRHCH
jgi:hypothetical protein